MAVRKTILMYRDREMLLTGQHSKWNYGNRKIQLHHYESVALFKFHFMKI
jgi:hypothetical protein